MISMFPNSSQELFAGTPTTAICVRSPVTRIFILSTHAKWPLPALQITFIEAASGNLSYIMSLDVN